MVTDGKQLFYYSNSRLHVVDIQTQPAFSFSKSAPPPISGVVQDIGAPRNYDITPDGKQFIVVLNAEENQNSQSSTLQINVVLNWLEELKQKVPLR